MAVLAAAVPAGAVLAAVGGAAPTPVVSADDGAFQWADAGIGLAVGLALAAVSIGLILVARRNGRRVVGSPATR